ncbi:MAG TPA: FAD-dependent monooxygenase [Actinocatenispora sp.]
MDVIVAGAGPTGLMLAAELRLAGADVLVVDRLAAPTTESRAGGLHPRTMEVLDQRGILGGFLAAGRRIQAAHFSGLRLDFTDLPTRYPFLLGLLQAETERLLADRAAELGVPVRRGAEVVGLRQDDGGVDAELADGSHLHAKYLVGCDGGRSTVRRLAGIDFPGTPATLTSLLGDVELAEPPDGQIFQRRRAGGDFSVLAFEPGWYRVMVTLPEPLDAAEEVTFERFRAAVTAVAGTDFGMHTPRWVSRFGDAARQTDRYRAGRVLLAGDAAHIHYPAGGQGLNTGVQDAVNLGWKLAAVVRGDQPDALLDTYEAERHPVAAQVLDNTRAQVALGRYDPQTEALRAVVAGLLADPDANARLAAMVSALDIAYDLGGGHPLVGRRLPDVDLADGRRAYELLHDGRPVLLDLAADRERHLTAAAFPAEPTGRCLAYVPATCTATSWRLPVLGTVATPTAVLVRPDGYVAWAAADGGTAGLDRALGTWCPVPALA